MPNKLKYKADEYPRMARKLCLLGATNADMADFFEVNEDTIYEWLKTYPDFKCAVQAGKMVADAEVAEALFKKATGYKSKEVKAFLVYGEVDENGEKQGSSILTEEIDKIIEPDTKAATWWLNCRQKAKWSPNETKQVDVNTVNGVSESVQAKLDEVLEPDTGE